jgi:uncharacterized membrane protein
MTLTPSSPPLATAAVEPAVVDRIVAGLTVSSAVGAGLMAGLLFAFSISIMPALRAQPAAAAVATMQSANVAILNPLFLLLFIGSTVSSVLLACTAPFADTPPPTLRVLGALLFLFGCIVVTAAINVPMNNTLAALDPSAPSAAASWATYLHRWTNWNHVRTGAAALACLVLTIAASR